MYDLPQNYDKEIHLCSGNVNGYKYFYDPEHPLSYSNGTVYHHRHVASVKIGRWLAQNEHVHHIDDNRENNHPDNLFILSPSEHSSMHSRDRHDDCRLKVNCSYCNKEITTTQYRDSINNHHFCSVECSYSFRRRMPLEKDELEELIWLLPATRLSRILGISDVAIAKWCKKWEIDKPGRGYWTGKNY